MDDALLVRGVERAGNLPRNRQGGTEGNRPLCNPFREGGALDQLQHESTRAIRFFQAVDGADVRVIQ